MNVQKLSFILLTAGIVLMIGALLYLDNRHNKTHPFLPHLPFLTAEYQSSVTPTGVIDMSVYRIGTTTVQVTKDGFSPDVVVVGRGSRIIWLNKSGTDATVNSDNYPTNKLYSPLNLGLFSNNFGVQLTFNKTGIFTYHDQLHPDRKGKIIVR